MLDQRRINWEIWRIARCGGFNELNREQRCYVRESLKLMYEKGGEIAGHRCFTNTPLLSLMDLVYREGRIIACSGKVATSPHGWCEIEGRVFEITFPLGDSTNRDARRFTLSNLPHKYKAEFRHEWTEDNFDGILMELFAMAHPYSRNLSPEGAAALLEKIERKLDLSLGHEHIALFAESAKKVHRQTDKLKERGVVPREAVDDLLRKEFRKWSLAASIPMFPHGLKT
jgi:hypothetical protein